MTIGRERGTVTTTETEIGGEGIGTGIVGTGGEMTAHAGKIEAPAVGGVTGSGMRLRASETSRLHPTFESKVSTAYIYLLEYT